MDLAAAQRAMTTAYVGGAPGALVSGVVWLVAGAVAARLGVRPAFLTLFFGGMLIVPLALVVARGVFHAPRSVANPLDRLGLETTFVLFAGLLIAGALLRDAPAAVFPVMAVIIGARYFAFRTVYDEPVYWALGGALVAVGAGALFGGQLAPAAVALLVGAIELAFATVLFVRYRRRN